MLEILIKKFDSLTKSLDVLYVIKGNKIVSRISIGENNANKIKLFLEKYRIKTYLSDFKILNQIDKNREFSDKGIKVSKDADVPGKFFMYISKSEKLAKRAKELEAEDRHKELGLLLGYPECCCRFFEKNFKTESKKKNDYTLATLRNSNSFKFPFYTNIAIRHMDIALLSHFPCSFQCKKSIKIAKDNLKLIEKYSEEYAAIIKGMLKGGVVYSWDKGIFLLRGIKLKQNKLFYDIVMTLSNNDIYNLLKNSPYLKIINKDKIKIGDNVLKKAGFMIFI